jgi:membrane protein implicated in regulation of membrane protease activity
VLPDLSHAFQFVIFAALAISSLAIWRLNYKKSDPNPRVGQSQGEEIGRFGILIEDCGPQQTGKIRFTQGLMGAKEWPAISDQPISASTEAKVVSVEGNTLRVETV